MIINNKHIRGLFEFKSGVEYEKDDMVVYDNCIYIVVKNVTSTDTDTPDIDKNNYIIYLGDQVSDLKSYYEEASKTSNTNKYVSSYLLSSILQREFFGLNDSGIIKDYVEVEEGSVKVSPDLRKLLNLSSGSILDSILNSKTLNNGLIRLSYDLKEIQNIYLESVFETRPDNPYYILRQYTYETSNGNTRVQELIDPVNGETRYRNCEGNLLNETDEYTGKTYYEYINPSSWAISNIYVGSNSDLLGKVKGIINCYTEKSQRLSSEVDQLKSCYKYSTCWPKTASDSYSSSVTIPYSDIIGYEAGKSQMLNVSIKAMSVNYIKRYSTDIDLLDVDSSGSIKYQLGDGIELTLTVKTSSIDLKVNSSSCQITNISYRRNYVK